MSIPPYYTILGRRAEKQHDERDDGQTIYMFAIFKTLDMYLINSELMIYDQIWSKDQKIVITDISNLTLNRHLKLQCNNFTAYVKYDFFLSEAKKILLNCKRKKSGKIFVMHVMSSNMSKINWNWWHEIELFRLFQLVCAKILLFFLIVCKKKSWKFSNGFSYASCSPGVLTRFFDQLQKDTLIIKLKSKQILEKTRHKFFSSFGLWTFFKNKSTR